MDSCDFGQVFISFCLVLSLTSHMTCEVQLLTLNGISDRQQKEGFFFFFLLYSFVFVGKYPHTHISTKLNFSKKVFIFSKV